MLIKRSPNGIDLPFSSEITPRDVFESRRGFIKQMAMGSIAGASLLEMAMREAHAQGGGNPKLAAKLNPAYSAMDKQTPYKDATTYNNFYEFGTDKSDPAQNAHTLRTHPWTVTIEGEVKKPMTLDLDALMKLAPLEERIYRLRCVEGWSMVIPWSGYSLSEIIKKVEPTSNAKYVEGLRIDEAYHPLTLLTLGMYGETLANQNGAPVRIVTPWKYGFKSAKSIVKIRFVKDQPRTSWSLSAPSEYGFYSNVNPDVDHPRWSQASERRIGEDGFLSRKRKTLMFNGYSDVAPLYAGMDLKKYY